MRTTMRMCIATILCTLVTGTVRAEDPALTRPQAQRAPATTPADAAVRRKGRFDRLELPSGPAQPTRLELSILQLICPTGILSGIDINRLTAGNATPAVIFQRLQQYGEASVGFQVDELIDLPAGTDITHGARVPTVQDVVVSGNGVVTPSVTYEKVGAIVKIRGLWREDDPRMADVAARIMTATVTQTPILVSSGVSLPAFGELNLDQTLQVRSGVPCCSLLNGNPVWNDTESVSTVHLLYLRLTRAGEPVPAPPAAAATPLPPQTMIQATVFEVTGEKEKLAQMSLGKEPPTNAKKLEEVVGWFGKMNEVSNPSLLAIWPSKSTLTMSMTAPLDAAASNERQARDRGDRNRSRSIIASQRVERTLGIEGRWSDDDPKQGKIVVALSQKVRSRSGPSAQTQPAETKLLAAETSIRDGVPCCLLGEMVPGTGDNPARRYVMLLTARRIAEIPATADEPK